MTSKARYLMVGGFLGAGKTTAILQLARHLTTRGRRVGLITNDQSHGLVDTAMLRAEGLPVQEITGGCFCCKFNSLVDAAERLARDAAPDVFIAEPVGSCTDLKATVSYPLRRMYGDAFSMAPLSVLIDPSRALRILGLEAGRSFSTKVRYVYGKQLEEAEILVINKIDLVDQSRRCTLRRALRDRFPRAELFEVSARFGDGLEPWFNRVIEAELGTHPAMDLDYDLYADGEALLGWLNCTAQLSGTAVDGNQLLLELARRIQQHLAAAGVELAHLKMTLRPEEEGGDLAVVNLVGSEGFPELSHRLEAAVDEGELILNLRAESDPEILRGAVHDALAAVGRAGDDALAWAMQHLEHFRPDRPTPTHRLAMD